MTDQNIFTREAGRLGIRIPRSAWKAAGHGVSAAMQQKGTLISHGQFSDWLADDLRQVDDEVVCFGPGFAGLSLEELLQSGLDETTMIQHLASVARALSRLDQEGGLPAGIQSAGVLVTADGDVLILPTSLVSRAAARTRRGEGPAPEGNPAIAASMMLAENLRRIFLHRFVNTPAMPTNDNLPPRRESDPFVPLGLIAPHLDPGLAILADRCMNQTTVLPSLDDWANAFNPVGRKKYFRDLTADDLASLESQRKASETRVARRLAFKRFMTKRGGLLSGLAIALVIIVGIAIFDRPPPGPDLSALGPEALVEAYYSAISTLDLATLDACLEGKAGKDDRSLVTNLTVVVKMRQAYSREAPFIPAEEWVAAGSPDLVEGTMLFGITDRAIQRLHLPGSPATSTVEARFEVRYTLWTTASNDQMIRGEATRRIDQLVLAQGKNGWKIISIGRENL